MRPWWLLFFVLCMATARVIQYSLYPMMSEKVIAWIENPPVPDALAYAMPYLLFFAGVYAFVHVCWVGRYMLKRKINEFARMIMAEDLQEYVNAQTIGFYAKTEPGKISRNVDYIVDGFMPFLLDGVISFAVTLCVMLFSAVLLFNASPLLGIIFLGCNILAILWTIYALPKNVYWEDRYADKNSEISGKFNDSLANFITVKLFSGAKYERQILRPFRHRLCKIGIRSEIADSIFWVPSSYILDVSVLACSAVSIYMSVRGLMPVSQVVFCILTYEIVTGCVFEMLMNTPLMIKGYSCAKAAYRELIRPIKLADKENASALAVKHGKIEIKDLSFRFDKDWVLKNFNLTIKPGEKIGLVGLSGKGKTTLVRLIMRFYDPESGAILIDGTDIRDVTQDSLRSNIAFVPQDETMFNRTLFQNIKYGRNNATAPEIYNAARAANAFDFIRKTTKGFNTIVGTRGIKLSGGQRQRISIARAFLKDAPILILDEATSALDSESENIIQESLHNLADGRTTIIIAHRLSTLKHMDKIVVLDKGKVAEFGSHDELCKRKGGVYAKLWQMQSSATKEKQTIC